MIFDRMRPQYGPQPQGGPRYQQVFDREAMADMGGGMGRMRPNPNGGINPNGMYTGGNAPPQIQRPMFQTGGQGQRLPMQQAPWMTGGNMPPTNFPGWQMGGNLPPQQSAGNLSRMLGRRSAYR